MKCDKAFEEWLEGFMASAASEWLKPSQYQDFRMAAYAAFNEGEHNAKDNGTEEYDDS